MERDQVELSWAFSANGIISDKIVICDRLFYKVSRNINLEFHSCEFIQLFKLEIDGGTLKFINCTFEKQEKPYELNILANSNLIIEDSIFNNSLFIEKGKQVEIVKTVFHQKLSFGRSGFQNIKIVGDTENQELSKIKNLIFDANSEQNGYLEIKDYSIEYIKFGTSICPKVRILGGKYGVINFSDARNLKNFQIFGNEGTETKIEIRTVKAHYLNLEGDILIKDVIIHNLDFSPFNLKNGNLRFQNVDFTESFKFNQSNLGKSQFIGVNFLNAKIEFNWSLFSEATFASIVWPKYNLVFPDLVRKNYWKVFLKKVLRKETLTDQEHLDLKVQREQYRQLKVVSENNKNYIDSLAFYKNEMRVYWTDMRFKSELSKPDYILVFLNRYISSFGQNYWLPLMWIAIFQTLFSVLIWNFEACKHCVEGTTCVNNFWSGLSQYLNWINPIFKAPENWSDGAKITSFFMRILNGFFIFHFVKAIRKYGK